MVKPDTSLLILKLNNNFKNIFKGATHIWVVPFFIKLKFPNTMKITTHFLLILAAGLFIFTACNDDDGDTGPEGPSFDTFTVNGDDAEEGEHSPGDELNFDIEVSGPEGLSNFQIILDGENGEETLLDSSLDNSSFELEYTYEISEGATNNSEYEFTFVITDNNNRTADQEYTALITRDVQSIQSYNNLFVGGQHNDEYGHFIDLTSGSIYTLDEAADHQSDIDAAYFDHERRIATIAGTSHEFTQDVYDIEDWNNLNDTYFKRTDMDRADFDAIEDDDPINSAWHSEDYEAEPVRGNLTRGGIYVFQTADETLGVFRINDLNSGSSGQMRISIKVQE